VYHTTGKSPELPTFGPSGKVRDFKKVMKINNMAQPTISS
jgi:hypothetical protein